MAFDGITIANIAQELNQTIVGGKINKIAQPENDELMITIKNNRTVYRLLLSASASLPLINDDLETCVKQMHETIQSQHFMSSNQKDFIEQMKKSLEK